MEAMKWIYFEGGEPFLFYPLMLEGMKIARDKDLKNGIVTNAYWASSEDVAQLWLKPFRDLNISDLSLSDDLYHYGENDDNPAKVALSVAKRLKIPVSTICIEKPSSTTVENQGEKGMPVIGGGTKLRGRAVELLTEGLPLGGWQDMTECPHEDLSDPKRVHIDPYGNVHLCQGLVVGNVYEKPLSQLAKEYRPDSHPICRPLLEGGPAALAEEYNFLHDGDYVDACHLCYLVRLSLLDRFPKYLGPKQVYGLE
jgi:MoaA/NifB/PqqE/SkfB family radical SAM enzyme